MQRIKKEKSFSTDYYPVVFWREDLQDLIDAMKSLGSEVTLSTDEYEFGSLDEAAQHFGSGVQFDFKVSASRPWAQLEFSRIKTYLFVGRGPDSFRVFHELDEIIKRQQRFPAVCYNMPLLVLFGVASGAAVNLIPSLWAAVPGFLVFPWVVWAMFVRMRRSSVLHFQRRSEARPFFERNRDQLLMYVITAIIGGLIVFAGGQLKDRFFPPANTPTAK